MFSYVYLLNYKVFGGDMLMVGVVGVVGSVGGGVFLLACRGFA